MGANEQQGLPTPDPALKRLERYVGTWDMKGRTVGSDVDNISGRATFEWLPGGFFMQQRTSLDFPFLGLQIESLELIGYDPESETFPSTVYSNLAPTPLPYRWEVGEDTLKITVSYAPWTRRSRASGARTGRASEAAGVQTRVPTRR